MIDGMDLPDDLMLAQEIHIESPYATGTFVVDDIEETVSPDGTIVTEYTLVMLDPQAW